MKSNSDDACSTLAAARNQVMFRYVNEKIKELNQTFEEILGTFAIACECGDATCVQMVEISAESYEAVRANPRHFVVVPGHAYPEVERVVSQLEHYTIVENTGLAGEIAAESDPRLSGVEEPAA